MGIILPKNIEEIDESIINALKISKSPTIESKILKNKEWDSFSENTNNIIYNLEKYHKHIYFLEFKLNVLDNNLELFKNIFRTF